MKKIFGEDDEKNATESRLEKKIFKIFSEKKLRKTALKKEILKIFFQKKRPFSATNILKILRDKNFPTDKSSVFRTVKNFEKNGILKNIFSKNSENFYEIFSENHAHFQCKKCGKIKCVSGKTFQNFLICFQKWGEKTDDFFAPGDFFFSGICPKCFSQK